jgi:phosphatidate cytidylyltransferase
MRALMVISLCCFTVGGVLLLIAGRKVNRAERRARWIKFGVYFVVVMTILGAAYLGKVWLQALLAVIVAAGALEVRRALGLARAAGEHLSLRVWTFYGLIVLAAWLGLYQLATGTVAYIYVVVAGFDGFSQVTGQLLGRHKLVPNISPGKTFEGAAGGIIGGLGTAILARQIIGESSLAALKVGLLICVAGLAGDLSASWLKRRAGIKDYGRMLPQHGGILDRFDSLLPALALCGPWFHFLGAQR